MKVILTQTLDGDDIAVGPFADHIAEQVVSILLAQNAALETSAIEYTTLEKLGVSL